MPYKEDFESTAVGRAGKFLADQDGAFEVHPCRKKEGKCLEQVITEKPIPWGPIPNPFTMTGNADWTDYTLQSDVLLDRANEATVVGRIDSANVFEDGNMLWPSGYVLRLLKSGEWSFLSTKYKSTPRVLASGDVTFDAGKWHTLQLRFSGDQIEASLDHRLLTTVHDKSHTHGMIAIGTDWSRAQFDNLSVN